jgi:hypothetical protein
MFKALHRACDDVLEDHASLSLNQDAGLWNAGSLDHGAQ